MEALEHQLKTEMDKVRPINEDIPGRMDLFVRSMPDVFLRDLGFRFTRDVKKPRKPWEGTRRGRR